jgi:hypothetical protein
MGKFLGIGEMQLKQASLRNSVWMVIEVKPSKNRSDERWVSGADGKALRRWNLDASPEHAAVSKDHIANI